MDLSTRKKNIFTFGWYAIVTLKFELARRNVEFVDTEQLWFVTFTFTLSRTRASRLGEIFFLLGQVYVIGVMVGKCHIHAYSAPSAVISSYLDPLTRNKNFSAKNKNSFFRVKELSYVKFVWCNDRNSGQGTLFTFWSRTRTLDW
jgi:hypothetical protein